MAQDDSGESITDEWKEDRKKRMVNTAIHGVAVNWQWEPLANVVDDWAGWSAAFRKTFQKRYAVERKAMMKAKQQLVDE